MKHSYRIDCDCRRCAKERVRRITQSQHTQPRPPIIQSDGKTPNPNCYTVTEFESVEWPTSEYKEFATYHLARCLFCNPSLIGAMTQ